MINVFLLCLFELNLVNTIDLSDLRENNKKKETGITHARLKFKALQL